MSSVDANLRSNSDRFLKVRDVACILGVSNKRAWELVSLGHLPALRLGAADRPGQFRVEKADLDKWIADRKAQLRKESE